MSLGGEPSEEDVNIEVVCGMVCESDTGVFPDNDSEGAAVPDTGSTELWEVACADVMELAPKLSCGAVPVVENSVPVCMLVSVVNTSL